MLLISSAVSGCIALLFCVSILYIDYGYKGQEGAGLDCGGDLSINGEYLSIYCIKRQQPVQLHWLLICMISGVICSGREGQSFAILRRRYAFQLFKKLGEVGSIIC